MKIKEYLDLMEMTILDASRILGVSYQHFQTICCGKRHAGPKLARAIEEWTQGAVEVKEMIAPKKEQCHCPLCGCIQPKHRIKKEMLPN